MSCYDSNNVTKIQFITNAIDFFCKNKNLFYFENCGKQLTFTVQSVLPFFQEHELHRFLIKMSINRCESVPFPCNPCCKFFSTTYLNL